jgi:hypothetical protein
MVSLILLCYYVIFLHTLFHKMKCMRIFASANVWAQCLVCSSWTHFVWGRSSACTECRVVPRLTSEVPCSNNDWGRLAWVFSWFSEVFRLPCNRPRTIAESSSSLIRGSFLPTWSYWRPTVKCRYMKAGTRRECLWRHLYYVREPPTVSLRYSTAVRCLCCPDSQASIYSISMSLSPTFHIYLFDSTWVQMCSWSLYFEYCYIL